MCKEAEKGGGENVGTNLVSTGRFASPQGASMCLGQRGETDPTSLKSGQSGGNISEDGHDGHTSSGGCPEASTRAQ